MNNDLHYLTAADPQRNAIGRFQYLSWGEFTGAVDITVASGQAWEIVFYQGQIAWSIDRTQPNRIWQRLLRAEIGYEHVGLDLLFQAANHHPWPGFEQGREVCWQYQGALALMMLAEIKTSELTNILTIAARETIFDLLQYSQGQKLNFRSQSEIFIERPPITINTEEVIAQAEVMWQEWNTQKLGNISPHKTPVIRHPVQLYRQTTPIIYQNLVQVITGKRTLREIAVEIDEDLLLLTRSLTRYIQTGIIELIDLPDLKSPQLVNKVLPERSISRTPSLQHKTIQSKLVICIDDNPHVCESMRAIVTDAGYRFIAIQDATQALPRLLENKPDLIFLDLIMPKVNGYEICGQIRRISALANTPIVILTGKDGLLDRVRSKVVGASEFTCKPITEYTIISSLEKYIGTASSRN
ncbi:response regulator [Chamaesiphon minutus]|uniref:Response regulator containing a CheY-like receiver domain and a GGDEF domain n=1 Tax=Chamaesiphon minutus (strain ATCC 27169 / PCC 6605) TaxID=1173020 RepID=K9UP38_CHAP6|nr:response regulator [Chamaesiphon minutus]AFY96438.1 response regulator containing a CheY-like receiver domain and a GGDEF domain [Chamaesiphon minutus PCC 6605]